MFVVLTYQGQKSDYKLILMYPVAVIYHFQAPVTGGIFYIPATLNLYLIVSLALINKMKENLRERPSGICKSSVQFNKYSSLSHKNYPDPASHSSKNENDNTVELAVYPLCMSCEKYFIKKKIWRFWFSSNHNQAFTCCYTLNCNQFQIKNNGIKS